MILLKAPGVSGEVAMAAGLVEGRSVQARRYAIVEGFCAVEAGDELLCAHDAEELCRHHGFRLADPEEQDAFTARAKKAKRVQERAAPTAPVAPAITTEKSGG